MRKYAIAFLSLFCLSLSLWAKDASKAAVKKGHVLFSLTNMVNGEVLALHTGKYVNAHGDTFTVSMYKYYISNIQLVKADGKTWKEKDSYHLVNEAKSKTKTFITEQVPEGSYTAIKFLIGVDSLHNVSGAQGGDLDPVNAMFWDWNTGYIMAKMEGQSTKATPNDIEFHMGGYSGTNKVLRWVSISFPQPLVIGANKTPIIKLRSDLGKWFNGKNVIDFAKTPVITTEGAAAAGIADNYADMFSLYEIEQ